jgi:hypothetical protein
MEDAMVRSCRRQGLYERVIFYKTVLERRRCEDNIKLDLKIYDMKL